MTSKFKRVCCLILAVLFMMPTECLADLKSSDSLQDSEWTLLTEYEIGGDVGNLQAMCSTDEYIVCLINSSNAETTPDTLVAFYKGGSDGEGNPVEQFSVAREVTEMDYEHGNGMTYNPETNEIVIAGGKNLAPENKGCVFVVDADTLKFKRKVKISDKWNVHSIDYSATEKNYLIQKGGAGGYDFVEADQNFNITAEINNMVDMGSGSTFQDLCVCGDDVILLPYNSSESYNGNIQVYSKEEQALLGEYQLSIYSDSPIVEAESVAELSPGSFVLGCAIRNPRRIALYGATLPMTYRVNTSIENGTIDEDVRDIDLGSDCTINWEPIEDYEAKELTIDDETVTVLPGTLFYTFPSMTRDHTLHVRCTEIPKFMISTEAQNGTVDASQLIRRDKDVTVSFAPNIHYEMDRVLVDGEPYELDATGSSVTLTNIQTKHKIRAIFKEIPTFMVTASAENGKVSQKTGRVYRDESYEVKFTPDEDYQLVRVYVDGERLEELPEDGHYIFKDVTAFHDIQVVYRWKYRFVLWILCGCILVLLGCYIILVIKRRRHSRYRRRERNIWRDEMRELRENKEE